MKNIVLPVFMAFLMISENGLIAQEDVTVRKKDFKAEKAGFKDAWGHLTTGDEYFMLKGALYGNAFDEYLKAVAYNSDNAELNYKTGVAALFSDNREDAAGFFLKALELKPEVTDDIELLTGRALHYQGKFDEAKEMYKAFLASEVKKKDELIDYVNKLIDECTSAQSVTSDTLRMEILNAGSVINSNYDEYSIVLTAQNNAMYYASRKELKKSSTLYDDFRFDENVYYSLLNNGSWSIPTTPEGSIITDLCEAPLYIISSGEELYIYAGYTNGGDILVASNRKGKWRKPGPPAFKINTGGTETSLTISPDGNEVWYVSDNFRDGLGGKDILIVKRMGEKKWSKPVNAGPAINSPYDEESVRFSGRGDTVWFASRGHNTIGGFDIFYSYKGENGEWMPAVNAGYPLNTQWDELFFNTLAGDDSTFYFVSNRSGGIGGLDIYKGRFLPPEPVIIPPPPVKPDTVIIRDTIVIAPQPVAVDTVKVEQPAEIILYLAGHVKDSETGDPVLARIEIIDPATDLIIATTASSDVDGRYRIRLPEKKPYMADFRASGFMSDMKRIPVDESYTEEIVEMDVPLVKIKVGKKVVLNNILFETGKTVLTPGSYAELDRLAGILSDTPEMKIEISGHTDNTGSLQVNTSLSELRARAVVDYLVKKGIDRTRLTYRGYGPQQPIDDNNTPEGRARNRRVEFKILEF